MSITDDEKPLMATDEDERDTVDSQTRKRSLSEGFAGNSSPLTPDSVYDFYTKELLPAMISSLPILGRRLWEDAISYAMLAGHEFLLFIQPKWMKDKLDGQGNLLFIGGNEEEDDDWRSPNALAHQLWEHAVQSSKNVNATIADFMLRNFDKDHDGHISPNELLNMTELLAKLPTKTIVIENHQPVDSFWAWFSREWPLMDWKIGVFLWQTFGGILLVIAVLSIMPGRLHTWSGKVLRWPILGLTYLLINIELIVYIAIRLVIRTIEVVVATPKHRALRSKMANASSSYQEWYGYAAELDRSQKRNTWQNTTSDETSYQYNWPLIEQLVEGMKEARLVKKDPMLALAVLQQCTRKNVGGIMNEDLFTKTYTGEPKFIVMEFIDEVTKTLHWVTDQTLLLEQQEREAEAEERIRRKSLSNDKRFREKARVEREKLWKSLVAFATLDFVADATNDNRGDSNRPRPPPLSIPAHLASSFDRPLNRERPASPDTSSRASCGSSGSVVGREQLSRFLKRARHAYGKTALCLSGGSMMGLYHLGHLKGLMETDCLPEIVSGTSAGSAIGAVLCTRTNEELHRDLDPQVIGPHLHCFDLSWPDRIRSIWKTGNIFRGEDWQRMIKWFTCGDMTFEEAYQKTGRVLCVALSATAKKTPPILINYISAPNVTIASAVVASAAVPGFVSAQQLMCKDPDGTVRSAGPETYFDGSIRHDIPTEGLSEMLNCHFFVACQCNPHIVPFFFNVKGGVGQPSRWTGNEQETSWRGGFLLAALEMYLKNDMKAKFVFLQDLDAAVSFTGTMMTQSFVGTTTIVPRVQLRDFFTLFSDPTISRLYHYLKVGSVAAYQHAAMIRCHYRISDALEECIEKLEPPSPDIERKDTTAPRFVVPIETPRKRRVSRMAGFGVKGRIMDYRSDNGEQRQHIHRRPRTPRDKIPDIITSKNYGGGEPRRIDSDSFSTASETCAPNT